ncbi:MAG TPA: sarcinarray family MAST domain-containing protein [Methanosarcinaceae archaeon]|nr:sarcinarray family MAST domain-containing protein [Methanosarcinaceae archaeon]
MKLRWIFLVLTMWLILFSGIAVAKSPYGEMDVYYNDKLLQDTEVVKPLLKINEKFTLRLNATMYQECKLDISLNLINETHFELLDGPADFNQLASKIYEANETHTFEWTLKPTDVSAGDMTPVNIHYMIFMIGAYDPIVNGEFTIAYPRISTEYYEDETPPIISNVKNNDLTNDSVTITWDTNKDSDSVIRYGTTSGNYTNEESDTALVSSHSISLSGLSAQTTYYYIPNSTDATDNAGEGSEYNFTTAATHSTTTVVRIGDVTAVPNGYAFTSIMINNASNLGSGEISVTYNSSVVHVTNVTSGDGNALTVHTSNIDNTAGLVRIIAWDTVESHNDDVVLAIITFHAVGEYPGSTPLSITSKLYDYTSYSRIEHSINNGEFSISNNESPVITDTIATPDVILNDNGRPRIPGTNITALSATVTGSGSGIVNVTIDLSPIGGLDNQVMGRIAGTDVWTVVTTATDGINQIHELVVTATDGANNTNTSVIGLTVLLRGDVVRDGNLNSADALYIVKYLVGKEPMPSLLVSDMAPAEGNGKITSADAFYLLKYLVEKEEAP